MDYRQHCRQAETASRLRLAGGSLLKRLCPWHVDFFRFVPSSSCQNIWFSFGEIFVAIFPSGFNYCHWNINGCPAGLIDVICAPSYLWSVGDKSEPCFAVTFIEEPQPEELKIDTIQWMRRYQICETGILIWTEGYFSYLNNLIFIEKVIYWIPKLIP